MKIEFIDNAGRIWWRRWSTWLAGIYAAASAYVLANPTILFGVIDRLPEPWHTLAAFGVGAMMLAVPVLTAQLKQPKLSSGGGDGAA